MNGYLEKHRFYDKQIHQPVGADTNIIVVIPCYNEPQLLITLQSLFNCEKTFCTVEIIVVINSGEHDNDEVIEQNKMTFNEATEWIKNHHHEKLFFHLIQVNNLPKKHAGVGLARKIGMDEAVARFNNLSNSDGVIVCLDADCTVEKNYLAEIEKHFLQNPKITGCSIYFEHPSEGSDYPGKIYEAIINYELFLRYYNLALRYCNFPYSFHTIGSSMAVRNKVYQKQGGMNRRKAGEDFYFLHKIFPLGNFTELNTTKVIPSPRESSRVPFGTGSAIENFLKNTSNDFYTYNFQTFIDLKNFIQIIPQLFSSLLEQKIVSSMPLGIQEFLTKNNFENKLPEIRQHSASEKMFVKRFFNWFDGFMVLKFVHFERDNFHAQEEILSATNSLKGMMDNSAERINSKKEMLSYFRDVERKNKWQKELFYSVSS